MTRSFSFAATVLSAALVGRASAQEPPWKPTEPSFVAKQAGYEVVPPPGWMRSTQVPRDVLLLTRDGTALQVVAVGATVVGKPLGPGPNRRTVTAGMSPQELAELVVDDVRATASVELQVVESAPASLAGRSGFRLVASYRSSSGLARRTAIYGVIDGTRFYLLVYVAAERVYFGRDLPVFDELARTFRVRAPEPPSRWEIHRRDDAPWYAPLPF